MAASNISLDLETLIYNLGKFTAAHQGISTGQEVIDTVSGAGGLSHSVAAETKFHNWLVSAVSAVGQTTDTLRANLTTNGDALREAARQLLEQNQISDEESKRFLALLDSAAGAPSPANPAPSSSSSTPDADTSRSGDDGSAAGAGDL